ncbi:hypothetical protein M0R04_07465 [Candidatus Dojkabacteria bacterium]|jgi:hypothetical protein|nr:hypothetical protein [Candidatus Dojkabacteria bacterium]
MNEIFNSTVHLIWYNKDQSIQTNFTVNNKQYLLVIDPHTYEFGGETYSFLNINFFRILNDGTYTMDLTLDTPGVVKVLGAIVNGTYEKIKEYQADAIILVASNNIEKRMRIYSRIAKQFVKTFGTITPIISLNGGSKAVVLLSSSMKGETKRSFIEFVKQLKK